MDRSKLPACPYCGMSMGETGNIMYRWYQCPRCFAGSPQKCIERFAHGSDEEAVRAAQEAAHSAADFFVRPENRVLTLEEVKAHCEGGAEAAPLWVEIKDKPRLSRWCVADEPEELFNVMSVADHIKKVNWAYDIHWRCWLRKPTKKEEAGTPWKG